MEREEVQKVKKKCVKCGRKCQSKTSDLCMYCRRADAIWKDRAQQAYGQSVNARPSETRAWSTLSDTEVVQHMGSLVKRLTDVPAHGPVKIYTPAEVAEYQRQQST